MSENVVIVGASDNPERYSYKALKLLESHGHKVFPVHPSKKEIEGHVVVQRLSDLTHEIDTVTLYINPKLQDEIKDDLITLAPKRVIFNPGTENPSLAKQLNEHGILSEEACTLVLLQTGQY